MKLTLKAKHRENGYSALLNCLYRSSIIVFWNDWP